MIASSVVEEVRRLLNDGELSQRQIARQLGVSRGTVNAIAQGKRPEPRRPRTPEPGLAPPTGPLTRCPGCGGLVLMPCLLCRLRAMKDRHRWEGSRPRHTGRPRPNHQDPCTSPIDRSERRKPAGRAGSLSSPRSSAARADGMKSASHGMKCYAE